MRPRVVLVTGISSHLGGRVAALLAADSKINTVIGVDTVAPQADLGRTQFVRADIRNPLISHVVAAAQVDTVVHLTVSSASEASQQGRHEGLVASMQLLEACQQVSSLRTLVVESTTAVYGSSPRDPAVLREDAELRAQTGAGCARAAVEVEGHVRGFARRRPDVALTVLRFSNLIGPVIDSPLSRYFSLPVVPSPLGFDPRIQLLHEDDAVEVLRRVAFADHRGIVNAAGDGVMLLSQCARRAGRPAVPVPAVPLLGRVVRRAGLAAYSPEQVRFLVHGHVADNRRLKEQVGYTPRYTTAGAFADFVRARELRGRVSAQDLVRAERAVLRLLERRRAASA